MRQKRKPRRSPDARWISHCALVANQHLFQRRSKCQVPCEADISGKRGKGGEIEISSRSRIWIGFARRRSSSRVARKTRSQRNLSCKSLSRVARAHAEVRRR